MRHKRQNPGLQSVVTNRSLNMDEDVIDHKETVVHEVEVPTTEQIEGHGSISDPQDQPDIVQGVPHSMAGDMSGLDGHASTSPTIVAPDHHVKYLSPSLDTTMSDASPNTPNNVKYLFCKFCPYKTRFVGNLTKHVRTHTGEKPFACRHCGKRFASRSNLNYHEATHTGNKRFMCFISGCQFKTQLRESLNSHMRKIHGVMISGDSPLPPGADALAPAGTGGLGTASGGLPMFSPGSVGTLPPNLPPIQDILTAPTSLSSMTLPQNSQVNLNDVKPSVAELAQYMIALHEGTQPTLSKSEASRISGARHSLSSATSLDGSANKTAADTAFADTSPEMATGETDNDSGAGSPRGGGSSTLRLPLTTQGEGGVVTSAAAGLKSGWDPQMMAPRLPPPTMHTGVKHGAVVVSGSIPMVTSAQALGANAPIITNLVDPKSSSLSNELLKIFSNLGLDTPAILDLLAAQGKLHICRACNIVFPEYSTFVLHRGCHGNEGAFQCHFCQLRFAEKFGFMTHFMQCPHK